MARPSDVDTFDRNFMIKMNIVMFVIFLIGASILGVSIYYYISACGDDKKCLGNSQFGFIGGGLFLLISLVWGLGSFVGYVKSKTH